MTGARAGERGGRRAAGERRWSLRSSIGFTLDPGLFHWSLEGSRELGGGLWGGALLQLGASDPRFLLAPTANLRYVFDLGQPLESELGRLEPFVQSGLGFAYIHRDRGRQNIDEVGFLVNVGGGLDVRITEQLALGSSVLFNVLPDETAGENFFFSWQFATVRFDF